MKLYLIRHGETDWNKLEKCQGVSDIPLNTNGIRQAKDLAYSLRDEELSVIYSSDLSRAITTAKEVAKYHSADVKIDERFREMDQGEFEGLEFRNLREKYGDILKKWRDEPETLRIPGGETLTEVQERAWNGINNLLNLYNEGSVLLVSHNMTIITLLCKFSKKSLFSFREFAVKESSKSVISCNNDIFKIELFNDISHLN